MKKFIKKHLSIILSFAIILTTLLPVLTGLGSVAALSAEEQVVVDNLKAAWEQMTTKPTSVLYPNYKFPNGSKTHMGSNIYTTANQATLPYGATADMLGTYYVTEHNYNVTNTTSNLDSNQRILFYGNIDNANNAEINVTAYDSFYFNIYFEELTSDLIVYANVVAGSADNRALAKGYTITADKKGSWVTIKDTDLINGGFAALSGTDKLNGLQLSMKTASTSTTVEVVVGSLQFVKNVPVPADSETANWTFVDWLKAALKVDLSLCGNTEDFITALAAAKSAFGEKYAIANLIKEWEALSVYHNPDINPNRWWNTSGSVVSANMTSGSAYTGTLPANVDLGANYATFTGLGNAAGIGSKQCVLYEFCKDGSGSSTTIASGKSSVPVNTIGDIYFWFKADNMAADITLNIQVMTNDTTAKNQNLPAFVIPSSKSGQWVKISLKEIGGTEWYGALTEKLFRVMVAMGNANGATVTVGSGRIVVPGACPVPTNVENTAVAWINAAKSVDTSMCIDATAFNNAVNALKAYCVEDSNVEILKQEWAKLEYIGTPDTDGFKVGIWQNGGTTYKEGNTGDTKLVYDSNVDTAYGANQLTATGVASSGLGDAQGSAYYRIAYDDHKSSKSFNQMSDICFWYKASGNAKARIAILGMGSSSCQTLNTTDNVVLTGDGNWHKVSVKDAIGETAWENLNVNYGTYYLQRLWVNIADFDAGVSSIDVTFGGLNYIDKDESLNGSDSWSNEQWVDKARALDLSDYKNTAAFEDAMYAAIESVYGITKAELVAKELIKAWDGLSFIDSHNILPNRWWTPANAVASSGMQNGSSYTGVLPEGVELGDKYAVFTGLGDVAATESKQCILYEFKDGSNGSFDANDRTSYNIETIANVYFWIKIDDMSKDAYLRISVRGHKSKEAYLIPETITIPASKSGQWVKISLKDEAADCWYGTMADEPFYRVMVALNNVSGATVTAGSGIIERKVGAPADAKNMAPEELLMAALALDLSKYGNTEKFVEKLNALKLLCEEIVAITNLKNAINGLSAYSGEHVYPRRYWDADGTLCAADTYAIDVSDYTGALPEGADDTNVKTYLGKKMATISGLTDMAPAYKTSNNKQTILFECGNAGLTTFTAHQIQDMYFWYKLDGAETAKVINGIYVKTPESNHTPYKLGDEITLIGDGKWHKVSFNEVYGDNWVKNLGMIDGNVFRVIMSIGNAQGGTITIGSIETIASAGLLPEATAGWTIADWIAAASRIDASVYTGADKFDEALAYAKDVRDRLMIARGYNLTEYDDVSSADIDGAAIGDNALEGALPTIYHSADGNSKTQVESATSALFTDNDSNTVGSVTGLDNSDEKSFTQFVYKFEGEANITDFIIYNDTLNFVDKYYIYIADSESALFTKDNLLVAYNTESQKTAARFNFDGKLDVKGIYIGIRAYASGDTVSFAEFKVFGEVVTYEVEKGNFSNTKIADIGENILDGISPKFKTLIKFDWKGFVGSSYQPIALTDDDSSTPVGFAKVKLTEKDGTIDLHIYYDLGTTYTIKKLFVNNWNQKGLETGKYEIYAANDVNSLFLSRSKILSYDNMVDGPNGTTISQLFTLKNEVIARFVSFRITYPISDWEYCESNKNYNGMFWPRLSELGVYGEEWVKPYALVNLTSHVPVDIYRTDSAGKTIEVSNTEYSGSEHKLTYDGKIATTADLKIKNGEMVDFVYNLASEMTLEEVKFKLASGTVKKMNIYASTVEDMIWKNESLIYSDMDGLGKTEFGKAFAETPLKARYLRFEIIENEGEDLVISEIEAIGGNDQEFNYLNLVEEKPESAAFYLQEVGKGGFNATTQYGNKWLWTWHSWDRLWPINKAFDNDYDSVYDLFGGKNGEESISMLLDLGTLNAIDDITLTAGSDPEYWPDEMNFYFGDDAVALFDKDAKPAQKWTESTEDGIFTYEFVPQVAQYVRIEVVRAEHPVYAQYFDHIATIIAEVKVNGLELKSRSANGIAATVEDEVTGIKAEILALRDNDVYDTIQDIMVVKREPTEAELDSAKAQGLKVDTDIYEIYFLDANGDIVTDTGEREVVIYIPEKLSSVTEDIFVLLGEFGELSMIEFDSAEGYYVFTINDISSAVNVALGYMVEYDEEFEEEDDSDYDDEYEDEDEEEEDEDEEETKRKKIKKVRVNRSELNYALIIILAAVVVVVIAAGVVLFIVLKKKKNKENEE